MTLISKIITKSGKNFRINDIRKTCGYEFIILFGTFIGQGIIKKRSKQSSRDLFLCIWLFSSLFLNFFYKSKLLSVLVVPKISLPFTNVYEMVEQEEVKWNLLRNRILSKAAERAEPNSTLGKIFAKSIGIVDQRITPEYLKEVRQGKLTIFVKEYMLLHTISELMGQNDNCLYTNMKEPFYSLPAFFFMRKGLNATIKTLLSKTVTRLTEAGIVNHLLYKDVRPSVFHCISSAGKTRKSLKILRVEDFIGIFALLLIGFTLAAFVFVLEFFI